MLSSVLPLLVRQSSQPAGSEAWNAIVFIFDIHLFWLSRAIVVLSLRIKTDLSSGCGICISYFYIFCGVGLVISFVSDNLY